MGCALLAKAAAVGEGICGQPFAPSSNAADADAMPSLIAPDPEGLPAVLTRQEALAAGLSSDQIRHRTRSGVWTRLSRGVFLRDPALLASPQVNERVVELHAARAAAAQREHPDCVIGFESACAVHGFPLVSGPPALVQLLVPDGGWTGIRNGVRFRECRLSPSDIQTTGHRITAPSRTWIDVARTRRLADALSAGDAALRSNQLVIDDVTWLLGELGSIRGVRLARFALSLIDGRRETPLESWSFAKFVEWEIPLPQMQVELFDDHGLIGRTDFYWSRNRVVGEADGVLKYSDPAALYAEKRREDRLRARGFTVIRWGRQDLRGSADPLRTRLFSALTR